MSRESRDTRATGRVVPGISWRIGVAMLALVVTLLAAPRPASAAVTCEFSSGVLFVDLGASSDLVQVSVSGANIAVRDLFGTTTCMGTTPTVNNTAALSIANHPGFSGNTVIVETAGAFAPGPVIQDGSDSGGGTPEIEIFANLNNAPNGLLSVRAQGGNIRFGGNGINPNAFDTEVQPDADIIPLNVNRLDGRAGSSAGTVPATLGAQGGAGTGSPLAQGIELQGNNGVDHLTGGAGNDLLQGFLGNDTIAGGDGDDTVTPGVGHRRGGRRRHRGLHPVRRAVSRRGPRHRRPAEHRRQRQRLICERRERARHQRPRHPAR